jgi:osmotically-inducible protein OsmY
LRGLVDNLSDVEAAEDVASRVPNVREVIEELDVR